MLTVTEMIGRDGEEAGAGPPPERHLGAYRVERVLGQGGMGEVFLAWDERLERHVAIKRIRPDKPIHARQQARFRREARAVARLNHPAIVQIFDILEVDGSDCIVMEHVEGRRLADLIAPGGLDLLLAVRLAGEIADGLSEAHTKKLIHRDLKPTNVMVTPAGHAKILDFGLARALGHTELDEETRASLTRGSGAGSSSRTSLTQAGALVGTAHAMSPEQANGLPLDHRSDLFALGGLLYEMVTGQPPFQGANVLETLWRVTSEDPPAMEELRPSAPPELARLVEDLLAKDPAARPQDARTVADELQGLAMLLTGPLILPDAENAGASPGMRPDEAGQPASDLTEESSLDATQAVRVLVRAELIGGRRLLAGLGDERAVEVAARHDRLARDLVARFEGLEIDKSDGFFLLFESPSNALSFALGYHQALARGSSEAEVSLEARVGLHLGEVFLRRNTPGEIARGAKPLEVDGQSKLTVERITALARARQTLVTRAVFDLARHAAGGGALADPTLRWLAHGGYACRGAEEPLEVFEVGVEGFAPLREPADSERAKRIVALGDELTLGWRPAAGQSIPHRANWTLDERIGEGGFGEIWRAEHKSGEKRVFKFCFEADRLRALKREVTLFRLLKEALGHRDDIARILDWNFDQAPYFLEAEYTEGGSLVDWAAEHGGLAAVPLAIRLELAAQVAEALAAAHSVGILHKDVKPRNVLIAGDPEGRPRARLTDFGIGLLTDRGRLGARGITELGFTETVSPTESSSGGTVRYMAPELLEGKPASIQADVYSLGVMLYQMVVGDFSRALAPGWRRAIEDDLLVEDIASFLDVRPERRPGSAQEVADALRSLEERRSRRAAERRAQQASSRARRRRRLAISVAALALVLLMIVSLFAFQTLGARDRERAAHAEADQRRQQAERLIDFMLGDLRAKLDDIGRLEILEAVDDEAMAYFAAVPDEKLSPSELLSRSRALSQIGDVRFRSGDLPAATTAFRQSLELAQSLVDRDPGNSEWRFGLGQSHFWVGYMLWSQRDLDGALEHFRVYHEISEALALEDPESSEKQLERAYANSNLGTVLEEQGDLASAMGHLQAGATIMETLVSINPDDAQLPAELAQLYAKLGRLLEIQGHLRGSLVRHRAALDLRRRVSQKEPDDKNDSLELAKSCFFVARMLHQLGEPEQAVRLYYEDVEIMETLTTHDPANTDWQEGLAATHARLVQVLMALGELDGARSHLQAKMDIVEPLLQLEPGRFSWRLKFAIGHRELAAIALLEKHPEGALLRARESVLLIEDLVDENEGAPETAYRLAESLIVLGIAQWAAGDEPGAKASWLKALGVLPPFGSKAERPNDLATRVQLLLLLEETHDARAAVEKLQRSGYEQRDWLGFRLAANVGPSGFPEAPRVLLPVTGLQGRRMQ